LKGYAMMVKQTPRYLWITAILTLVTLSCSLVSPAASATPHPTVSPPSTLAPNPKATDPASPPAVRVEVTPKEFSVTSLPPANTPVSVSTDNIQVDYVYTDNLVTSLYHLYGTVLDHFVDITLTNSNAEPVRLVIKTEVTGYTSQAIDTVDVPANDQVEIHQDPRLLPEAVDQLNAQKSGEFHIRIVYLDQGEEKVILDETCEILLYSRRDFVWIPGFEPQEEYDLQAVWVTPNDPAVEALIRAAANYDPTGIITSGYGGVVNDEEGSVYRRLKAIYDAEGDTYHLTYISTMTTFGPGSVQRMRLPAEVLDEASGNCVELAALFASAAEALGLETAVIHIPGHAYTAVRMDEENANYYFIETTVVGRTDFATAINLGSEDWADAQAHVDANEEGYYWVTIPAAREKGILPIPWK
jgi:hypothetical protein